MNPDLKTVGKVLRDEAAWQMLHGSRVFGQMLKERADVLDPLLDPDRGRHLFEVYAGAVEDEHQWCIEWDRLSATGKVRWAAVCDHVMELGANPLVSA